MKKVMGQLSPIKNWEKIYKVDKRDYSKDITRYPIKFANQMLVGDKKLKILEAGVGTGNVLIFFKKKGHDVIGIDFEPKVISRIKNKYPKLDFRVGNVLKTEFKDNTFDIVTLFGVIHYFEEEKQIIQSLKEMYRILKPGGKICFSVAKENLLHRYNNFKNILKCGIKWKKPVFEHSVFTKKDIINLTFGVGFKNIIIEENCGVSPNILDRIFVKNWVTTAIK